MSSAELAIFSGLPLTLSAIADVKVIVDSDLGP